MSPGPKIHIIPPSQKAMQIIQMAKYVVWPEKNGKVIEKQAKKT